MLDIMDVARDAVDRGWTVCSSPDAELVAKDPSTAEIWLFSEGKWSNKDSSSKFDEIPDLNPLI